jgi:hypothetical protein
MVPAAHWLGHFVGVQWSVVVRIFLPVLPLMLLFLIQRNQIRRARELRRKLDVVEARARAAVNSGVKVKEDAAVEAPSIKTGPGSTERVRLTHRFNRSSRRPSACASAGARLVRRVYRTVSALALSSTRPVSGTRESSRAFLEFSRVFSFSACALSNAPTGWFR